MKLYKFNNRRHQHTIDSALCRLRNLIHDADQAGRQDLVDRYTASYNRLDDVCDRQGIYNSPWMLEMPYDDWKILDSTRRWYEGIRLAAYASAIDSGKIR